MDAKRIRLVYGILLSVVLIIAGLCLMWGCVTIYQSGGEQIYTPEKVADTFRMIALPVYLALAMTVVGFLLSVVLPGEESKKKAQKNLPLILRNLHQKKDISQCQDEKLAAMVKTQQKRRSIGTWVSAISLLVGAGVFFGYVLSADRFVMGDVTGCVIRGALWLLPCVGVPAALAVGNAYLHKASLEKEICLMKQVQAPAPEKKEEKPSCDCWVMGVRIALVCAGIALVICGFAMGGWQDVLTKAINICTECVGLG